ncbi:keratin, type I cytoskeletal 9-like [Macrobrachium nipponense]|uniref:keratin, type I cytoskeletal 9-like n=1 Tax=Macrobrachium nipponense TaxID=159736 RepID=UPI0030C880A1
MPVGALHSHLLTTRKMKTPVALLLSALIGAAVADSRNSYSAPGGSSAGGFAGAGAGGGFSMDGSSFGTFSGGSFDGSSGGFSGGNAGGISSLADQVADQDLEARPSHGHFQASYKRLLEER